MDNTKEILLHSGEGTSYWVLGDLYTFKATGKQTGGAFFVMEQIIQPQGGPPPHIHHREDEAFYVLDGKFVFLCGDAQTEAGPGSFVYIPKRTLHTFKNIDTKQGKLMVTVTPAGLEEFFFAIGSPAKDQHAAPAFDPGVIDKVIQLADQYHMEVILPGNK